MVDGNGILHPRGKFVFFQQYQRMRLAEILIFISKNYYWDVKSLQKLLIRVIKQIKEQERIKHDPMCGLHAQHVSLYLWVTTLKGSW